MIWYEAPDTAEFDSRTLFTRLNVGRIPLTDAELVKALLLVADRAESTRPPPSGTASSGTCTVRRYGLSRPEGPTGSPRGSASCWTPKPTSDGRRSGRTPSAALSHLRNASAPHRGVATGSVGRSRRPALAGPRLVRRPRSVPQDRLSRRGPQVVVPRTGRVGARAHEARVPHCTQRPHPRQPQALEQRCQIVDVPDRRGEDEAGAPPDERRDGTPQNAVLGALLLRRPRPAAVVHRAHPCPELAKSQHGRAVDRMAGRASKGFRCPRRPRSRTRRS